METAGLCPLRLACGELLHWLLSHALLLQGSPEEVPTHKVACRSSPVYLKNQEVAKLKETIKEQEMSLGVEHTDTLTLVSELGRLFYEQGAFNEAKQFFLRALEGR